MSSPFKSFTGHMVGIPQTHPVGQQVGAFCFRRTGEALSFLLVTSSNGRWILPKGWPIAGKSGRAVAMTEAWEEAGVRKGDVSREAVVSFNHLKRTRKRGAYVTRVHVHTIEVTECADSFPEADQRQRQWVTEAQAKKLITDPDLRHAIATLVANVTSPAD